MTDEKKLEIINAAIEKAANFKSPLIEYNFDTLPKDRRITETSFDGVPSKFNRNAPINSANIIWSYGG